MSSWLDEVLVCPLTKAPLVAEGDYYISTGTPVYRYPIREGVPLLLPNEAEEVTN